MRSKLITTIVITLLLAASGPAVATHEGTWHGDGKMAAVGFCEALGAIAGTRVQAVCEAVFD